MSNGPIDEAPTPQNTPANASSYISRAAAVPSTINELGGEDANAMLQNALLSNPLLQSMIESKLQTLVGEDSGYITGLPRELKHRIYALKALEMDQYDLEAKFQMKLLELEREFADMFSVVNKKRRALIIGEIEAEPEAITLGKELLEEEDDDDEEEEGEKLSSETAANIKGVPGFWLTALQNVPMINGLITDRDFDVLDSLIDIRLEYLDTPGYKLVFEFEENEFFSNGELTKTYYYQKELGYTGEFVYDHSEGCEIDWKSNDVNVTVEIEQRKQRNKHTKQVRVVEKTSHVESFFNFFTPPQLPETSEEEEEGKEEEEEEKEEGEEEEEEEVDDDLAEALQLDYMFGEIVKDKLILRAIDCFTGEAIGNGLFDMEDNAGEEEFEDDDEEDDEDEEDESGSEEGDNVEHSDKPKQECQNQ